MEIFSNESSNQELTEMKTRNAITSFQDLRHKETYTSLEFLEGLVAYAPIWKALTNINLDMWVASTSTRPELVYHFRFVSFFGNIWTTEVKHFRIY